MRGVAVFLVSPTRQQSAAAVLDNMSWKSSTPFLRYAHMFEREVELSHYSDLLDDTAVSCVGVSDLRNRS